MPLTMLPELASHASRDMISSTEFVSSQLSIMLSLPTQDALSGIGTIRSALNVQLSGPSTLREFVCLFLIFVLPMMLMEPVPLASKDMIWLMEPASSHHSTTPNPPTQDVLIGTGITKSAWLAPKDGLSMLIQFVPLFLTFVLLMMPQVLVLHASRDTNW